MKLLIYLLLGLALSAQAQEKPDTTIVLTPENSVMLVNHITPINLADTSSLVKSNPDVKYLVIFSYGGLIGGIDLFIAQVSHIKDLKVLVIQASSAAAAISQGLNKPVYIVPHGKMMFHRISSSGLDPEERHEIFEWIEFVNQLRKIDNHFVKTCMTRMNITRKKYDSLTISRNWDLTAKEALKVKAVDKIVNAKCSDELRAKTTMVKVMYSGDLEVCNLIDESL